MVPSDVVPVIDLSDPIGEVGEALDAACRDTGFFQVINHGVSPSVEETMWTAARQFFDLPEPDKQAAGIVPGEAYGYSGFGSERLAASRGEATPPDLKETFSVGPFQQHDTTGADDAERFVFSPNRWPAAMPQLAVACRSYSEALANLAARLLEAMAVGLALPRDFFESSIDQHASALRLLNYPDLGGRPPEPGQLRAGAHTDYGTLTLLRQDNAPGGLQVRDVSGVWHSVPAVPGAYVVNVGDALERWTNDRWRSTLHRVMVPPVDAAGSAQRQSIAFFHNANWDASLACLPTCCDDSPARYEPISAGRHLMEKFARTQPAD